MKYYALVKKIPEGFVSLGYLYAIVVTNKTHYTFVRFDSYNGARRQFRQMHQGNVNYKYINWARIWDKIGPLESYENLRYYELPERP